MFLYLENDFVKYFSEEKAVFENGFYKIQTKNGLVETKEVLQEIEYTGEKEIIEGVTYYGEQKIYDSEGNETVIPIDIYYNEAYIKEKNDKEYKSKISELSEAIAIESGKLQALINAGESQVYIDAKTSLIDALKLKLKAIETEIGAEEFARLQIEIEQAKYSSLLQ